MLMLDSEMSDLLSYLINHQGHIRRIYGCGQRQYPRLERYLTSLTFFFFLSAFHLCCLLTTYCYGLVILAAI